MPVPSTRYAGKWRSAWARTPAADIQFHHILLLACCCLDMAAPVSDVSADVPFLVPVGQQQTDDQNRRSRPDKTLPRLAGSIPGTHLAAIFLRHPYRAHLYARRT